VSAEVVARLRQAVIDPLKERFVDRGEVIDLIALALTAGEHLFLYGPPGTAKSALIRHFARAVHGRYFEYMLTRFSEPNEIFGPIDIGRLREGVVATVTTGMLPEAEFVFLDELFNANSAILNNLLTVLNERTYRRGAETHRLPLLSLFSASNHLPEDDALKALFDRFLLRCPLDNLPRESMPRLLAAGWELERPTNGQAAGVSADDLRALAAQVLDVDLGPVRDLYAEVAFKIRDLGIGFSDRRAVKGLKVVAASALLCGRTAAQPADLWVLRYLWDRAEQIGPLRTLVNAVLEQNPAEGPAHPLAARAEHVDAEDVARQLDAAERELQGNGDGRPALLTLARLRERVAALADRAAWVADENGRQHLLQRSGQILKKLQ
jgi:MoxR-like ATPase